MALEDVTRSAVERALEEFRDLVPGNLQLSREKFLAKYCFGASKGWVLLDEQGREYDAKAVLGAAHGFISPKSKPLKNDMFHGGIATAKILRALGFNVLDPGSTRSPPWSRDELILALDLYRTEFTPPLRQDSPEVAEASELLGHMAQVLGLRANADFRNPNGVYMKMMNYRRHDPAYAGAGKKDSSRGDKDEMVVWAEFAGDRARLAATAAAIRAAVAASDAGDLATVDDEGLEEATEGKVLTRLHRVRERNRELVETRKAQELKASGRLRCEACGFDSHDRYGERGRGFIEAHHTRPVHTLTPGQKTRLADLALVCANCHRMIHARRPWLGLDELRTLSVDAV